MSAFSYQNAIRNALITAFQGLTHSDGSTLFSEVLPLFVKETETSPICEILFAGGVVSDEGLSSDNRTISFRAVSYFPLENSLDNADAQIEVDKMGDVTDRIIDYLEQIPHPLENAVPNVHVYAIANISWDIDYTLQTKKGLVLALGINFDVYTDINNKDL